MRLGGSILPNNSDGGGLCKKVRAKIRTNWKAFLYQFSPKRLVGTHISVGSVGSVINVKGTMNPFSYTRVLLVF